MEEHVHSHFLKVDPNRFLDPMFRLNVKVRDVWNSRKVFVRDCIESKARLVYPVKPSPPDPSYLPEFLKMLLLVPRNGIPKFIEVMLPEIWNGTKGDGAKDHNGAMKEGELELDIHDTSDGEEVHPYDIGTKLYHPYNDTQQVEEEQQQQEREARKPQPGGLVGGIGTMDKTYVLCETPSPQARPLPGSGRRARPVRRPSNQNDPTLYSSRPSSSSCVDEGTIPVVDQIIDMKQNCHIFLSRVDTFWSLKEAQEVVDPRRSRVPLVLSLLRPPLEQHPLLRNVMRQAPQASCGY
ncbi:unnamed protein product [Calypogeia fissa]